MRDPVLTKAIEKAGGVAALASSLNITTQAVSQWRTVPAERTLAVSDVTGIPPHKLRPDIYRAPPEQA